MRIISGEYRRRNLLSPPDGATTRPIPDRVKESVFSLLRGHCEGAAVLDCFAGTGAIGLEAVSRGASRCVFVEQDKRVVSVLERNIAALGCGERCEVARSDALGPAALSRCPRPVDLIFFDPPYPLVSDEAGWLRVKRQFERLIERLSPEGYAILRTPWPFRHGGEEAHAHEEERPRAKGRMKGGRRGSARAEGGDRDERRGRQHGWMDEDGEDGREVEMVQRGDGRWVVKGREHERAEEDELGDEAAAWVEEELADEPPVETTPRVEVDLTMAGARGPETHAYGNTAVHLYMKA